MDKDLSQDDVSESGQPEEERQETTDVAGLLKKIQQHLIFLEKKIDALMTQSTERPAFKKDFSSRPARPFGRSNWSGGGKRHHHGEKRGGFGGRERSFGDRGERPDRGDRGDRGERSDRGERGDRGGFRGGSGGGGGFRRKKKHFE